MTDYMTMLPRLDLMMQWAWYDKSSELLNYRFGLVKGGIAFGFPDNWSVGSSIDDNTLNNLETGDKSFDSYLGLLQNFPAETSFFMFDTMVRWSNMDTTISSLRPVSFQMVRITIRPLFRSLISKFLGLNRNGRSCPAYRLTAPTIPRILTPDASITYSMVALVRFTT